MKVAAVGAMRIASQKWRLLVAGDLCFNEKLTTVVGSPPDGNMWKTLERRRNVLR